jgi:hypothetical protein
MSAAIQKPRALIVLLLFLVGLDLAAPTAWAGGPLVADSVVTRAAVFFGGLVTEIMNDRGRMIQASVVIVALGIACLWWKR